MKVEHVLIAQPGFGVFCATVRRQRGLTLRTIEQASGVPRSTWARVESGDDVRLSVVSKILAWASRENAIASD